MFHPQVLINQTVASNPESEINFNVGFNSSAGTLSPVYVVPDVPKPKRILAEFPSSAFPPVYVVPDVPKPKRILAEFPSSAVFDVEYEPMISPVPEYKISNEAEQFISKQKKAVEYRNDLITISNKISEFLKKSNIEPKISISLFQDPEYTDWIESKIIVVVKEKEFAKAYGLYGSLLDFSLKDIKRRTIEKVVIGIEKI